MSENFWKLLYLYIVQRSSNFSAHQNYLGKLAGSHFRLSSSVMGPDKRIPNKFPDAADSAGSWTLDSLKLGCSKNYSFFLFKNSSL